MESGVGEGMFLMKTLADSCVFSKGGRRVRLEFMIQGIEQARSLERVATFRHFFEPKKINV